MCTQLQAMTLQTLEGIVSKFCRKKNQQTERNHTHKDKFVAFILTINHVLVIEYYKYKHCHSSLNM